MSNICCKHKKSLIAPGLSFFDQIGVNLSKFPFILICKFLSKSILNILKGNPQPQ